MKKVLFLYTEIAPYLVASVQRLATDHRVEVHVVRWPVNKEAPFDFSGVAAMHMHERTAFTPASLEDFVRQLRPDIIFCSGWMDKGYLRACRWARAQGTPVVMASDTAWRGGLRQWVAVATARMWLPRTFSHAWVTGEEQAHYARRLGFSRNKIERGFYTADLNLFSPLAEDLQRSKKEKFPHRFLCVARYIPSKGHQYLVEAFAELCESGAAGDWELVCIGTGELYPLAFTHPRIKHLGFAQATEVRRHMQACGVFVLPSIYEPWGVVVHEHAAAGFPLVLSNAVGARHRFLREGVNGVSFEAGSKQGLQDALRWIMGRNDDGLLAMGRESARLANEWGPAQWAATAMRLMNAHE